MEKITLVEPAARIALMWSLRFCEVIVETLPSDRQMLPRLPWRVLSNVASIELPKELSQVGSSPPRPPVMLASPVRMVSGFFLSAESPTK